MVRRYRFFGLPVWSLSFIIVEPVSKRWSYDYK
nr:MAG TPA: hypothetical protein [Caudoviricetes sp.]